MQTARRGLSGDERDRATAGFLEAVRWATFAQETAPELVGHRQIAATDPPDDIKKGGPALTAFNARRRTSREIVTALEPVLFPPDEAIDG